MIAILSLRRAATGFLHGGDIVLDVDADGLTPQRRPAGVVRSGLQSPPTDDAMDVGEHLCEGTLNVDGLEGGGLHEEAFLSLSKGLGVFRGDGPQVAQVGLVTDDHDDGAGICVAPELLEPSFHVLEGDLPGHVIHQQGPNGPSVVRAGDGSVSSWKNTRRIERERRDYEETLGSRVWEERWTSLGQRCPRSGP